jgi:hypothetical protein
MKKCNALTHSINDDWANIFYSYTNTYTILTILREMKN